MKKILVVFIAIAMLASMSGLAFANVNWEKHLKGGSRIDGKIIKDIFFDNNSYATSGNAYAEANDADTDVDSDNEAKARDDCSIATNNSPKVVDNQGLATAYTPTATATNNVNNNDDECINETAESTADCDVCITGSPFDGPSSDLVDGGCHEGICDCCPAVVKGGADIGVTFKNYVTAITGDAEAYGNDSDTDIDSNDSADACKGGYASNENPVTVTNNGDALAFSGEANATNNVNNTVLIKVLRSAMSSKNFSIYADFAAR